MAYQALYRKWRPLSFDDVVGQGHVVTTLKNEISSGKTAHAYLFCGTRGTGKTSCAKIFARAINCLEPQNGNPCNKCEICTGALEGSILDITEIDAASNNGVDNIREIRDEVSYSAAQAKYKIYIIDEVHMLSGGAFNALLKTLEEPPPYVVFILATTEAHKLPATITSRCQRFDFKRIAVRDIVNRLREIVTAENIDADIEALELIARLADGAMRDALSILDQCAGACEGKITACKARGMLSLASDEVVDSTVDAIADKNHLQIIRSVADVVQGGKDINNYIELLIQRFRDILVCKVSKSVDGLFEYSSDTIDKIKKSAAVFGTAELSYIIETLCAASADAKWQKSARTLYELALLRLCDDRLGESNAAILSRLERLEAAMDGGAPVQSANANVAAHAASEHDIKTETAANTMQNTADDAPPWDVPEPVVPKAASALEKKAPSVPDMPAQRPVASKKASSNVWGELLGVLKKKYPPLYGALSMKKAKFANNVLYLINETYVKQILTMMKDDFNTALMSVAGDVRINFVTEAEFGMIEDEGAVAMTQRQKTSQPKTPEPQKADDEASAETAFESAADSEGASDDTADSDDPLDALLSLGNDDIVVEE